MHGWAYLGVFVYLHGTYTRRFVHTYINVHKWLLIVQTGFLETVEVCLPWSSGISRMIRAPSDLQLPLHTYIHTLGILPGDGVGSSPKFLSVGRNAFLYFECGLWDEGMSHCSRTAVSCLSWRSCTA